MDDDGTFEWVSFLYDGVPEYGEARTLDDGSVWARIPGVDGTGGDDRWLMVLGPDGGEADGVSEVRLSSVDTVLPADGLGHQPLPAEEARSRTATAGFILDMYEMGVYDEAEAGARLYEHFYGRDAEALPEG